jgi:retron-type reverse transcriptase
VATNKVTQIAEKVINPSQTAFLPGRNIMEGVIVSHETIHGMHRKKESGIILKIDFEKAYDKINWSSLQQTLRTKGFSPTWCKWILSFMEGGHVDIKVKKWSGRPKLSNKKGLRQGDPLSPILFNIVVDILAILINRAKEE